MDQMGHVLDQIIYGFAEAEEDDVIFQGKTDMKDGFWRCVTAEGQEWNFPLRSPSERRRTYPFGHTNITVNGADRIAWIFLCRIINRP